MINGFECCDLNMTGSYYLVVEHRNHLIVMSHVPVQIVGGTLTYDFTTQQSYILGSYGQVGQKPIGGKYAMYGGNGLQVPGNLSPDTDINENDQSYWEPGNGRLGYNIGDYDMNGDQNENDPVLQQRNNGLSTSVIRIQ